MSRSRVKGYGISKVLAIIAMMVACSQAFSAGAKCESSNLLSGKLITDICWSCMFPLQIAGQNLSSRSNAVPSEAATDLACSCIDETGDPLPGVTMGMWEPARLIEITRAPGCSTAMNGADLGFGDSTFIGSQSGASGEGIGGSFYHYHYYSFPLFQMLDLLGVPGCVGQDFTDFDVMFVSELDATWNNSELAFFQSPEAAMVSNPVATAACIPDSIAAAAGEPIDSLFWCAGQWGNLYPFSGHHTGNFSTTRESSLLSARVLATIHRRGFARKTMGNSQICSDSIYPRLPKSQYKFTTVYPKAETQDAHVLGEPTFLWGGTRTIPGVANTPIYLMWRWQDCCAKAGSAM